MPKLEYFLVSESVSIDQQTNRISVFNVLEQITLTQNQPGVAVFPRLAQMVGVAHWLRNDTDDPAAEYLAGMVVHSPGQDATEVSNFAFRFSESGRARVVFYLVGPPAIEEGELRFELLLNGNHAADHIIRIVDLRPSRNAAEQEPAEQIVNEADQEND